MKAFVTGATGFVGGHLVDALLERGDDVTAFVRDPGRAREIARRGIRLAIGSLGDAPHVLADHLAGADIVYHVAGLTAARDEAGFLAVNRDGTAGLVEAATLAGHPAFVLVSSLAAAGPTTPGRPLDGTEEPHPVTRYGRSKLAGETVVRASALPWTILRPPAVYGPADREMFRVFKAASLGIAPVFGRGDQQLSLVFGPDLAGAIAVAGASPAARGRIFNVAHPEILTTRTIVEAAGRALGRRVRVVGIPRWAGNVALRLTDAGARLTGRATVLSADKSHEFFAPAWLADTDPFTTATGWSAAHDFAAGAAATVAWYRERGWL